MGFSGDNTTVTCLSHKMKYKEVACGNPPVNIKPRLSSV